MSAAGKAKPAAMDEAGWLDGRWVRVPTTQRMHDGSVLSTWGVQVNGIWIGRAHPIGPSPAERALARHHAGLFAASRDMAVVLQEALEAWSEQFDGEPDRDLRIDPSDLLDWFAAWRLRARAALGKAGAP